MMNNTCSKDAEWQKQGQDRDLKEQRQLPEQWPSG